MGTFQETVCLAELWLQSCSHVAVSEPKMSPQPGERETTTLFKGSSVMSDRVVIINIGEKPPTDS